MNFTWVAEDYYQNSQFQYDHAKNILAQYIFNGNESVLDVGCGDGKITADIADIVKSGQIVGIDSSEQMIKFAKLQFETKHNNLSFKVCPVESIDYSNQFDLIVSFACLHWVKDQLSFLNGAKMALKETGKIILTLYPKHPYIWDSIEETTNMSIWKEYFEDYENPHISYDAEKYKNLAEKAGLNIMYLEEKTPVAYFASKLEMEEFLRSWLPHIDQVHPQLRNKFLTDIGTVFMEKAKIKKTDKIGIPFRRLDVILSKE